MIFLGLGLMVGVMVFALSAAALIATQERQKQVRARQRIYEEARSAALATDATAAGSGREVAKWIGSRVATPGGTMRLRQNLALAGFHDRDAAMVFLGTKIFLLVATGAFLSAVLLARGTSLSEVALLASAGAVLAFFLPNFVVSMRRKRRATEIRRHLPNAIDLLEICVSAGMGLDTAWNLVSEEMRRVSVTFSDEMELTALEFRLGVPRPVAMRHMAERTEVNEIGSLVGLLLQSERFGASISDAFRTFARAMREDRSFLAEEQAEKTSVKMIFPMVGFIFPALLIVLAGPAVLGLVAYLSD